MGNGLKKAFAATKGKVFKQAVVCAPPSKNRAVEIPGVEKPDRVWRLMGDDMDVAAPGGLTSTPVTPKSTLGSGTVAGIQPVHRWNAFLEDPGHDWRMVGTNTLRYCGSNTVGGDGKTGCWLLLEYGV